jgi:TonB family protein
MLTHGKKICKTLKEIRQQIAKNNDITLITSECHYKGECKGTCPKCEAEVRYLENELNKRRQLGKAVAIAGISLGLLGSFTECFAQQKTDKTNSDHKILTDTITPIDNKIYNSFIDDDIDNKYMLGFVESMPEPVGGFETLYKYLTSEIKYPETTPPFIPCTVVVEFIVEKDGRISNVKALAGVSPEFDQEAVRVVKMMPKWKPAEQMGKPVRRVFSIPIRFSYGGK